MRFREITVMYCENHMEQMNTQCGTICTIYKIVIRHSLITNTTYHYSKTQSLRNIHILSDLTRLYMCEKLLQKIYENDDEKGSYCY